MISEKSLKKYCCEDISKIENYAEAVNSSERWVCHHRLETHTSDGKRRLVDLMRKELIALDMYYHRPAEELTLLTRKEHNRLHYKGKKGKPLSEEHKRRISQSRRGKGKPLSEEHKRRISQAMRSIGQSDEFRRKMSAAMKGKPSPRKGKHLSEEHKRKIGEANKGQRKGKPSTHHVIDTDEYFDAKESKQKLKMLIH